MSQLRALLLTDRTLDERRSPGFRWRVRSVQSWLEGANFDVELAAVTEDESASILHRLIATVRSVRRIRNKCDSYDIVFVHALNAPHMVWLSLMIKRHGAVVVDLCDSLVLWEEAVSFGAQPFFRVKVLLSKFLVRRCSESVTYSYVTARDAAADELIVRSDKSITVVNRIPDGLDNLNPYHGPPRRLVIAADLSSFQNIEAMVWFEDAISSKELEMLIPVEVYGPDAPSRKLPDGVVYKGWATHLRDIYLGQTAVFAPTVRGAGLQNKYLEAVVAGRPVVIGMQPAGAIPGYTGALPFETKQELIAQLKFVQKLCVPLSAGHVVSISTAENERSLLVLNALAACRR